MSDDVGRSAFVDPRSATCIHDTGCGNGFGGACRHLGTGSKPWRFRLQRRSQAVVLGRLPFVRKRSWATRSFRVLRSQPSNQDLGRLELSGPGSDPSARSRFPRTLRRARGRFLFQRSDADLRGVQDRGQCEGERVSGAERPGDWREAGFRPSGAAAERCSAAPVPGVAD